MVDEVVDDDDLRRHRRRAGRPARRRSDPGLRLDQGLAAARRVSRSGLHPGVRGPRADRVFRLARPPRGDRGLRAEAAAAVHRKLSARSARSVEQPTRGRCRSLDLVGPMGELGALFNPGMRHELEERQAKAARREEEGNARDGDLRIDLESGVAVINIPGDEDDRATGRSRHRRSRVDRRLEPPRADAAASNSDDAGDAAQSRPATTDRRRARPTRAGGQLPSRRGASAATVDAPAIADRPATRCRPVTLACASSGRRRLPSARQQPATWSSTMPVACISAYAVVGPKNLNPRRLSSLAIAVDSAVIADEVGHRCRPRTRAGRRERPQQLVQADVQVGGHPGVVDRGLDLGPVPHDRGVGHQPIDVAVAEVGDPIDREAVEGAAGTPAVCAGSSTSSARTGRPPGTAARTGRRRRAADVPTRCRGTRRTPARWHPTSSGQARPVRPPRPDGATRLSGRIGASWPAPPARSAGCRCRPQRQRARCAAAGPAGAGRRRSASCAIGLATSQPDPAEDAERQAQIVRPGDPAAAGQSGRPA